MTDLIERLRIGQNAGSRVCEEAADEIERLRAVYEAAEYVACHMTIDRVYGDSKAFRDIREAISSVQTRRETK